MSPDAELLLSIFRQSMAEVDLRSVVEREIRCEDGILNIAGVLQPIGDLESILLVALGKAGGPMFEAAFHALRGKAGADLMIEGFVVGTSAPEELCPVTYFHGAHPIPDEGSRAAADALLGRLRETGRTTFVVYLISGGGSAMIESPLDPGLPTESVAQFYRALVHSGLPIGEMNVLRKHLSAIKGGRLAAAAKHAAGQATLIVSDVPRSGIDVVASGPSMPDSSSFSTAVALLHKLSEMSEVPPDIRRYFELPMIRETPKSTDPVFLRSGWKVILSSDELASAAAKAADRAGLEWTIDNTCDDWDYKDAADYLLRRSSEFAEAKRTVCVISVGELSVRLKSPSGMGGRNQQFVLHCAIELARDPRSTTVLSVGSDGVDGNSPAAGAYADEFTVSRAIEASLSPVSALENFDAYPLFTNLGQSIETGPTGHNLRDLRLILTRPIVASHRYPRVIPE